MRKAPVIAALIAVGASVGPGRGAGPQDFSSIEHGRYLANAADCGSCHTAPGSDHPFSGGRPIETPFGTLVAPNITPDRETGIGDWTDDQFDAAVRHGRARNGARLYPAMPFPYYTRMSRKDVADIRAYLATVEPVHNAVRVNRLPFPVNIRSAMTVWDQLYFKPGEYHPDTSKSAEWNRGAYLVQGPGHCGACHTPKTWLGGDKTSEALRGYTLQGWTAPDITSGQGALGNWSVDDVASYLKTGHNRNAAAAGLMSEVVEPLHLQNHRRRYQGHGGLPERRLGPGSGSSIEPGQERHGSRQGIYQDLCSSCHTPDGKGVPTCSRTCRRPRPFRPKIPPRCYV